MVLGTTQDGVERGIERTLVAVLRFGTPVVIVGVYLWRILAIDDPAQRFFDDFFYYLVPAEHWVDGAGSTFFPGEPTNGYHPLWFLWVALLYWLCGDGGLLFTLLDLSLMVLLVGFCRCFERFLLRVTRDRLCAAVGVAVAAIPIAVVARAGIETALTVCVAALLLAYLAAKPLGDRSVRDAAVVGLLAAVLMLSRLDAVALLAGLAVVVLPGWGRARLVALASGMTPLYVYLLINWCAFGHLATTSMTAKTLGVYLWPNWYFVQRPAPIGAILMTAVPLLVIALQRAAPSRPGAGDARRIALALAVAPLLQFGAQALRSGWILFPWYEYFTFMTLGLAAALIAQFRGRVVVRRVVCIPLSLVTLAAAVVAMVVAVNPDRDQVEIAAVARKLQAFALQHPGVYAMGDSAGTPGWLLKAPIVQLEGLAMSHAFLDRIRKHQPLNEVLRDFHVDYYVDSMRAGAERPRCLDLVEPNPGLSSPRAPHMAMASCVAPIAVITLTARQALVYRIDRATGRPG